MKKIESTQCNKCISSGGGDCATCTPATEPEQQPAPETERMYLISESELERAHAGLSFKSFLYVERDAAIAAEARKELLEEILTELKHPQTTFFDSIRTWVLQDDMKSMIESLRKGVPLPFLKWREHWYPVSLHLSLACWLASPVLVVISDE